MSALCTAPHRDRLVQQIGQIRLISKKFRGTHFVAELTELTQEKFDSPYRLPALPHAPWLTGSPMQIDREVTAPPRRWHLSRRLSYGTVRLWRGESESVVADGRT